MWMKKDSGNDSNSSIYPGALEICDDGVDNDCDGTVDENGAEINTVAVDVSVSPVTNYLPVTVGPLVRNLSDDITASLTPSQVSLLLIGPQPLLDEIAQDETLLAVYVDAGGLEMGIYSLPVLYEIPEGLTAQVFPSEVEVELALTESS